jgi:hypothetical protein
MDALLGLFIGALLISLWITHLITCFAAEAWGLLIAGALFFPVAIVHGAFTLFGHPFV